MSKKSELPSRGCKDIPLVKQPLNETVGYMAESHPMELCEAVEYFGRQAVNAFRAVNGAYNPTRPEGIKQGKQLINI